jgi:hypothetical protein
MRPAFSSLLCLVTLLGCGRTSEIAAIDDAGAGGATGGTGGVASGGSGGTAGSGGSGGTSTGGTSGSGGSGAGSAQDLRYFHGCELPTGAIRYGIYQPDPVRDLCFMLVVGSPNPTFADIEVVEELGVENAYAWQGADTCGNFPPAAGAVDAIGGSGTVTFSPILVNPPLVTVDVTLEFPSGPSWLPASEKLQSGDEIALGFDCSSCNDRAGAYQSAIEQAVTAGGGTGCTSLVRLDYAKLNVISHQLSCSGHDEVSEAEAEATAISALVMAPDPTVLTGADETEHFVFRGVHATPIPEADRLAAAVNQNNGNVSFGVRMGWTSPGGVEIPTNWLAGKELGGGCTSPSLPATRRGFALDAADAMLAPSELDRVIAKAFSTAMSKGIDGAWGGVPHVDAVVLRYSPGLGFDEPAAEYVVIVNHAPIVP